MKTASGLASMKGWTVNPSARVRSRWLRRDEGQTISAAPAVAAVLRKVRRLSIAVFRRYVVGNNGKEKLDKPSVHGSEHARENQELSKEFCASQSG
jgi:hypothetical protein